MTISAYFLGNDSAILHRNAKQNCRVFAGVRLQWKVVLDIVKTNLPDTAALASIIMGRSDGADGGP